MVKTKLLLAALALSVMSATADNNFAPPIMGWSSWNTYHVNISDSLIRTQADAMVRLGLKDLGYNYINIDDGFFGERDADGEMLPHKGRFPNGMKVVADYIHSLGLKAGIYSDAGANTCGSKYDDDMHGIGAGLYGHEEQDARLYFKEWGYDFIKIDYCGGNGWLDLDEKERYTAVCRAIEKEAGHKVSVNICRWTFPGTWAKDIATSWRISPDIRPKWSSVKKIISMNTYLSAYATDGHYNDMDMLEIGRGMSVSEEEVHMGMWCMMSSPLLIGCDLNKLKPASFRLLANKDLIAINQDPLGLQAYVAERQGEGYVFVKDILERRGKTRAVALYNPSDSAMTFSVSPENLELGGKLIVKPILGGGVDADKDGNWKSAETYKMKGRQKIEATVEPHGVRIYTITCAERLEPSRYEAEWAYMPCFDNLGKRKMPAKYIEIKGASGGAGIKYVGGTKENCAQWRDVWSEKGGRYRLTFRYVHEPCLRMIAKVNGAEVGNFYTGPGAVSNMALKKMKEEGTYKMEFRTIDFEITLNPGFNTIEMGSPYTLVPELDCFTITPLD